ncbi:hypothetical protein LTR50_007602 [Elasticomyces elasticus]|nr:hypothetical protein LTR50_007602 [Elasticomyces elasticus]
MLGLHEWGMCRGVKGWIVAGVALRNAQAMGLQYEHELDDEPLSRSMALSTEAQYLGVDLNRRSLSLRLSTSSGNKFIDQEMRRRTFWSCFTMDRYLSSGKYRPHMLNVEDLRIQLPASEQAFLFGDKVRTLLLGEDSTGITSRAEVQSQREASVKLGTGVVRENADSQVPSSPNRIGGHARPNGISRRNDDEDGRWEVESDEGLVSRYIKILEIYGKVVKWSCSGGRRQEQHPPWHPDCMFFRLRHLVHSFQDSLPRQYTLSQHNTSAHIQMKTSTPYFLVHAVYSLCQMILHREYIPFIPIRCSKPQGPLDPPLFPPSEFQIPPNFWEDSARECMLAARDLMGLVSICQEWNVLVETPIVGFALYTVAFIGVYCLNFPWMDPDGYMCSKPITNAQITSGQQHDGGHGAAAARKALQLIGRMRPRLQMADGWFKTIKRMHTYFNRIKKDYRKNIRTLAACSSESEGSPVSTRRLSLREGGTGGGLEEYKLLERVLRDFGNLEDEDYEMKDAEHADRSKGTDGTFDESDTGSGAVKSEDEPMNDHTRQERWHAINTVAAAASHTPMANPPVSKTDGAYSGQWQQPTMQSSAPSQQYLQINNFRPYSAPQEHLRGPSQGAIPPQSGSPGSYTASTTSQTSPSFDRNGYPYTPQSQAQYASQAHSGFAALQGIHAYATSQSAANPSMQPPPQPQPPVWDLAAKENWLNSLDTRLGGDDIAAFVDGGEWQDWVGLAASQGFGGGWLSAVWENPNGGVGFS